MTEPTVPRALFDARELEQLRALTERLGELRIDYSYYRRENVAGTTWAHHWRVSTGSPKEGNPAWRLEAFGVTPGEAIAIIAAVLSNDGPKGSA